MDVYDFAIKLENEAEKHYAKQAEKNIGNEIGNVCRMLAKEEKKHADLLIARSKIRPSESAELKDSVFSNFNAVKFKDIKVIGKDNPDQLDFFLYVRDMEQRSIELYGKMISETEDSREKELLEFIMNQEKKHFELFEQIELLLRHAAEWPESAEFGLREEY